MTRSYPLATDQYRIVAPNQCARRARARSTTDGGAR